MTPPEQQKPLKSSQDSATSIPVEKLEEAIEPSVTPSSVPDGPQPASKIHDFGVTVVNGVGGLFATREEG